MSTPNPKTSNPKTEAATRALAAYFEAETGAARADLLVTLPEPLLGFAHFGGYNNARKCVADFVQYQPALAVELGLA